MFELNRVDGIILYLIAQSRTNGIKSKQQDSCCLSLAVHSDIFPRDSR